MTKSQSTSASSRETFTEDSLQALVAVMDEPGASHDVIWRTLSRWAVTCGAGRHHDSV